MFKLELRETQGRNHENKFKSRNSGSDTTLKFDKEKDDKMLSNSNRIIYKLYNKSSKKPK